jgi:hypothetical protein
LNDLALLTGRPRKLCAGGVVFRLHPLRISDLGRFQAWLDEQSPDPLDSIHAAAPGLSPGARRYLASGGPAMAERFRPLFGSTEADALATSIGGISELLYLSIRRGRRFTRPAAEALYWHLDEPGLAKLRWAIWGTTPGGESRRDDDDDQGSIDWFVFFHKLMNDPYRLTPDEVGRMTMAQARCLLSDGKPIGRMDTLGEYQRFLAKREARKLDPWAV